MDAPDTVASASPGSIHSRAQGASVIQVESPRLLPWLILSSLLSGFAVASCVFCIIQMQRSEREFQLLKIQQQMTNAWLARAGFVDHMDAYNGPEGNWFYQPPRKGK